MSVGFISVARKNMLIWKGIIKISCGHTNKSVNFPVKYILGIYVSLMTKNYIQHSCLSSQCSRKR